MFDKLRDKHRLFADRHSSEFIARLTTGRPGGGAK